MSLFAKMNDMPEIYRNWEEAFLDTKEEISDLFETFAGKVRVCILRKGDTVAAQLCLLPVKVMGHEAEYIYAVATNRAYRNEGLCTQLLKEVALLLKQEGKCGILVPADMKLQAFYKKRGFADFYFPESFIVRADERQTVKMAPCTVKDYIKLRQIAFRGKNCVEMPEDILQYALANYLSNGYRLSKIVWQEKEYGILYCKDESLKIQEITASDNWESREAGAAFLSAIGEKEAILQRSYRTMGIYLPKDTVQNGYFNLVLD